MNKFITTLLIITFNFSSFALAEPMVNARTAIVIDYHSDKVLYEYEPDIQIYPASMTKIMTAIVTFDLLALFGEGTSVNLDLAKSGASSEITLQGSAGTTDGIEKLFVSTSGGGNSSASFIKALGASGGNSTLTEFHVSGAKKLTVTTAIDFAGTASGALTTGTISAAESTGGVALAATTNETKTTLSDNTITVGLSTDIIVSGGATVANNLHVIGNLKVDGTQTILNTIQVDVQDNTIGVASTSTASNTTANGAGFFVHGGGDGNKEILFNTTKTLKELNDFKDASLKSGYGIVCSACKGISGTRRTRRSTAPRRNIDACMDMAYEGDIY